MIGKQWLANSGWWLGSVRCEVGLRLVSSSNHGCFGVWAVAKNFLYISDKGISFMKWIGFFIVAAVLMACAPKAVTTVPNSDAPAKESAGQYKDKRDSTSAAKGRSSEKIMEVVRANTPNRLKPLYNNFLRTNPGFEGKITVKFKILPDGNIETGEIVSATTNFPEFEKAVLNDILQWKFDAGDYKNCTVTIPFTFADDGKPAKKGPANLGPAEDAWYGASQGWY